MTGEVLRNVVRWGTGDGLSVARVDGQVVPLAGKTGTTNSFRNAAFVGLCRARETMDGHGQMGTRLLHTWALTTTP